MMSFFDCPVDQKRQPSRRAILASGTSLVLAPWLLGRVDGAVRQRLKFSDNPFQLGVASGDPSPDGAVIWTRLAPKPLDEGGMPDELVKVRWEIADDEQFKTIVRKGHTIATPQLAHSVHVELKGLEADRDYWYRFHVSGEVSPVGRTRTAPRPAVMPAQLRFAVTSCQHYETGYYTAFRHMAAEDLQLVVQLGDYIYESAGRDDRVRKHRGAEIVSLEDYRRRYAQYKSDADLQAAHAACPWLMTWDDHEFDNNYAGDISEEEGTVKADFLKRRADAYQVYYEHMPLRRTSVPRGADMQLYRRVPFGRLADFFVLDTRQYRTDQPNGDGNKPLQGKALDPKGTLLGTRQEKWLMAGLIKSQRQWNVLAQQVMMARVDRVPGEIAAFSMDQWSGYDAARTRLLRFIAERRVPNPVVLTGDIHKNYVNDLKVDFDNPDSATVGTEFVGTSITSGGDGSDTSEYTEALMAENPFVRFHNNQRGYIRCTITPQEWRSDYQVVPYVSRPGAPLATRASFVVESGKAGAEQA